MFFFVATKKCFAMTLRILNYMILKNHHMMTQMGGITILLTNHLKNALLTLTNPFVGCHKYDSLNCHSAPPSVVPITSIDENSGARFFINIDLRL
jgi:hypothetical protein